MAVAAVSLIARDSRLEKERVFADYAEDRDRDEAVRRLQAAKRLNPDFSIDVAQARVTGDARVIAEAVKREPENAELWLLLAQLQQRAGDDDAARDSYARARELAPRLPRDGPPRGP